jgi:hypothetical protein
MRGRAFPIGVFLTGTTLLFVLGQAQTWEAMEALIDAMRTIYTQVLRGGVESETRDYLRYVRLGMQVLISVILLAVSLYIVISRRFVTSTKTLAAAFSVGHASRCRCHPACTRLGGGAFGFAQPGVSIELKVRIRTFQAPPSFT